MISRHGFCIGQKVQFRDDNLTWREGEVVEIVWGQHKIHWPSGMMQETRPTKLKIAYRDSLTRRWRETEKPLQWVRSA